MTKDAWLRFIDGKTLPLLIGTFPVIDMAITFFVDQKPQRVPIGTHSTKDLMGALIDQGHYQLDSECCVDLGDYGRVWVSNYWSKKTLLAPLSAKVGDQIELYAIKNKAGGVSFAGKKIGAK